MDCNNYVKQLEEIVEKLESGECSMEESAKLFEQGTQIAKNIGKQIQETKGKVTIIKQELDKIVEEDFN